MGWADTYYIRDADNVSLDYIGDALEALFTSAGPLAWTGYDPTWGVTGGGSFSTNPAATDACYYTVVGGLTLVRIYGTGTTTGTIATITVTLPTTPSAVVGTGVVVIDGGTSKGGLAWSSSGTLSAALYDRSNLAGGATTGLSAFIAYYN